MNNGKVYIMITGSKVLCDDFFIAFLDFIKSRKDLSYVLDQQEFSDYGMIEYIRLNVLSDDCGVD